MGLERTITFQSGTVPDWNSIGEKFKDLGIVPVVRMIDGQLAFPDERPEATWSELRLGLPAGMVTLRREGSAVRCLVWGNADPALLLNRDQSCWALAAAGGGIVIGDDGGPVTAAEFRTQIA